jgi:cell division protein FtsQ
MGAHLEAERMGARARAARGATRALSRRNAAGTILRWALWALGLALGAALLGELAYHFLIGPRMTLKRVAIEGDPVLTVAEVLATAGIALHVPLQSVDAEAVTARLEASPAVRRAVVTVRAPDALVVDLERRVGVAMALVGENDQTVPVVFDGEGVIFAAGTGASGWDLPLLSGLAFTRWTPGTRLPVVLQPLLDDLASLRAKEPALFALISEVKVARTNDRQVDLLIYTTVYDTPVRAGVRITADLLRNAALLLDVLRREHLGDRVGEVDFRTSEVIYRESGP